MSTALAPPDLPSGIERRATPVPVEFRAAADGAAGPGIIYGYAAKWNSLSRDLGGFKEELDPAVFGEALDDGSLDLARHTRVIGRTNHDSNLLLGTTDAETLRLAVDDVGLAYEIDLPDTTYGRDLAVLARRGDIRFSSFAFWILPEGAEWRYGEGDELVRRVTSAVLVDVAPVADPAYWGSSSEMRSVDLDAVRTSLTPPPGPPGDWERSWLERAAGR